MKKNNIFLILFYISTAYYGQRVGKIFQPEGTGYQLTITQWLDALPPEDQMRTNTCWSFSGMSFVESEIMQKGKIKNLRLSKMFIVRHAYPMKAAQYLRMHGKTNLAEGGGFPDVLEIIRRYGLVPEDAYPGFTDSIFRKSHRELEAALQNFLRPIAESAGPISFEHTLKAVEALCDVYLGKAPQTFTYEGKTFTPIQFAEYCGFKPDDYIFLTSFTHHPYYKPFVLEVPDNWMWEKAWNLPLDEFRQTLRMSIQSGHTIAWAADVTEPEFLFRYSLALLPSHQGISKENLIKEPVPQRSVTPLERQKEFDNYLTQDDHGMHIIGTATDQKKNFYYIVKNSWGTKHNSAEGYFYASEEYVLMKTTSILVHKDAVPANIRKKLQLN